MRKLAMYLVRLALAFVTTFVTAHIAFAADTTPAQRECHRRIMDAPAAWIHESMPLTHESRATQGSVCTSQFRASGAPVYSSWNGKRVTIKRGRCNDLPMLEIDVPGEQNRIYIIDTLLTLFSWDQAHTMACDGFASSEADKANWRLPTRNQKAHFKFMIDAGFLQHISDIQQGDRREKIFATFVDEELRGDSIACYGNSFNGYAFSESFLVNTIFGMRDADFVERAGQSNAAAGYIAGTRDHAAAILIKWAIGRQIYDDERMNRQAIESLSRVDNRHKQEIKRRALVGGIVTDASAEAARSYIITNMDWTVAIDNSAIRKDVAQKKAILATTEPSIAYTNRDRAVGGGLRVYCVTEQRR